MEQLKNERMKAFAGADRRSGAHEKHESSGFLDFLPQEMKELKNEKMKVSLAPLASLTSLALGAGQQSATLIL